jgi:lysozyme
MKITKASKNCIDLIKTFEGFVASPYKCPAGVWTIGYGSTRYSDGRKVLPTDPSINETTAVQLLAATLKQYEVAVDSFCRDDINQNQFDALVDFAYNCGVGNLKNSTLLKRVNANPSNPKIHDEFMKWVFANGKVMNGLKRRREAESKLYFK